MSVFNYQLSEILGLGFYEVYRLWTLADEILARRLYHLSKVIDRPYAKEDYRDEIVDWLRKRQPRALAQEKIPDSVVKHLEQLAREINGR